MGTKDVKFVISAKNEATKAIDAVADALKGLAGVQDKVGGSAKKADGLLAELGEEFRSLNGEIKALTALAKVAEILDKTGAAVGRMEKQTRTAAGDFARLARDTEQAKSTTNRLKAETDNLTKSLTSEGAALAKVKGERTKANKELRDEIKLQGDLEAKIAKHAATRTSQVQRGSQIRREEGGQSFSNAAQSARVFMAGMVADAQTKVTRVEASFNSLTGSVRQTTAALEESKIKTSAAVAAETALSREMDRAAKATREGKAALTQGRAELGQIQKLATETSAALGGVAINQESIGKATAKANEALQRSTGILETVKRYSSGGGSFVDPKTAAQSQRIRAEIDKVADSQKLLQEQARSLAVEIARSGAPTRAQTDALAQMTGAARAAKNEIAALETKLAQAQGSRVGSFGALNASGGALAKVRPTNWDEPDRLRAQMAKLAETQRELTDRARAMAGEISRSFIPTKAQTDAFRALTTEARAAKDEIGRLQVRLAQTQGSARGSFSALNAVGGSLPRVTPAAPVAPAPPTQEYRTFSDVLKNLKGAWNDLTGEGRQSLSLYQRLRGEVLSMTAAYLGLQQGVAQIGGILTAYQKLEAAQNRLGAVFQQNQGAVRNELQWLERQAARLGIEFGQLADEYGKFSVAANAANFTSANTRKIFLSVAEAARVNKLSQDQMSGVFLAIEQMISKGKVSSEELRRQLGDRMAGAFNIFAQALGLTAEQLDDLMRKGEVLANESTLLKFANELDKRFGSQLAESLKSTTTLMGQWVNEIYQAQIRVGQGGFIKAFNALLSEMISYFRSDEGRQFFLSLGAALGTVTNFVTLLAGNLDSLGSLLAAIIALKVAQFFVGIIGPVGTLRFGLMGLQSLSIATMFTSWAAAAGIFRAAMTALMGFFPTLLAAVAVFGGIQLFTGWIAGVDSATDALDKHKALMQTLVGKYEEVKRSAGDWAKALADLPKEQIDANIRRLRREVNKLKDDLIRGFNSEAIMRFGTKSLGSASAKGEIGQIAAAVKQFETGEKNIFQLQKRLSEFYDTVKDDKVRQYLVDLNEQVAKLAETQTALSEASAVGIETGVLLKDLSKDAELLGKNADGSTKNIASMSEGVEVLSTAIKGDPLGPMNVAIDEMKSKIPELNEEMKRLKEITDLNKIAMDGFNAAVKGGDFSNISAFLNLYGRAAQEISMGEKGAWEAKYAAQVGTPEGETTERMLKAVAALAQTLGVEFKELMKIISYETAGTFDPWKKGPTTQWGQHQGLIQMGGPQRQEHGYLPGKSIEELVAAVGRYLVSNGLRAGDDGLQMYSIINAGGRDRFGKTDEDNGGAPGTVADKYFKQMPAHMAKVEGLLKAFEGVIDGTQKVAKTADEYAKSAARADESSEQKAINDALIKAGLEGAISSLKKAEGQLGRGNIDLTKRPVAKNDDGSISTVRSMSITVDGKVTLIPTVSDSGKVMSDDEAEQQYMKTGKHLGQFDTVANADAYAKALSAQQALYYSKEAQVVVEQAIADFNAQGNAATNKQLEGTQFEIDQRNRILAGKKEEAFIEAEVRKAREANANISAQDLERVRQLAAEQYRVNNALTEEDQKKKNVKESQERINQLEAERNGLLAQRKVFEAQSDQAKVIETDAQIAGVNAKLKEAVQNAIAMWRAIGGPEADAAIAKLQTSQVKIQQTGQTATITKGQVAEMFASGVTSAARNFTNAIANGEDALKSLGRAFLQFAADFLMEIAQMIMKQMILNALQSVGFGGTGSFLPGILHSGGVAGSATRSRSVSPNLFSGAMRYHGGGIAGLRPGEVPAILEVGEEILPEEDPRHVKNQGKEQSETGDMAFRFVNVWNEDDLAAALSSSAGERVFVNHMKRNLPTIRKLLGV